MASLNWIQGVDDCRFFVILLVSSLGISRKLLPCCVPLSGWNRDWYHQNLDKIIIRIFRTNTTNHTFHTILQGQNDHMKLFLPPSFIISWKIVWNWYFLQWTMRLLLAKETGADFLRPVEWETGGSFFACSNLVTFLHRFFLHNGPRPSPCRLNTTRDGCQPPHR